MNQLLAADDQQLVEALTADRPDPPLGDGVGVGRLNRCADDLGASRTPDIVERPGELGVSVADQEVEYGGTVTQIGEEIAGCWVTHGPVGWAGTPAKCTRRLRRSMTNNTYSRFRNTA